MKYVNGSWLHFESIVVIILKGQISVCDKAVMCVLIDNQTGEWCADCCLLGNGLKWKFNYSR
jgi:hypothetical protein